MSDMRISGLTFDRGIDSISYGSGQAAGQHLPERQELAPSSEGVRAQLSQLLDKPNMEDFLNDALRPTSHNRELLTPGRFTQAMEEALAGLSAAAELGGDDARVLNRAVRLLKEESGLRDLVAMYRSALYQG